MTVKTGRHIIRRDGQVVDAEASWKIGPAVSSSSITGASASATWGRPELVSVMETDHTDHDYNGDPVEIDWQDADGTTRVFTGRVQSTSGGSLELPQSQLTDGTDRLSRKLDLRPMAYTLPVHPINAGHGGRKRHVGLFGIWFTHQAMVTAGFDPGVPMHWSSVWYQSMCGSVATVPDADHAYASRGDLRTAYRTTDPDLAPGFVQDENQIVAQDVYTFGVTASPRPGTENLPWQLTWDLPIDGGNDGELVLRNLDTAAGLAVKWSTNNMSFYKHNATGTQDLLGTVVRDRDLETGDKRWSVIASPSGNSVIVRTDARGEVARWEGAGTVHPLPTGKDGLCTIRTTVPGKIGTTAITRGNRHYMTTEPPKGKIMRHSLVGTSLPGWPSMPDQEAGRILTDQADAHRGLRGQPLWSWVDHNGLLVNTDFDTLAARPVVHEFDTRPDSGALGLDGLTWGTDIPGAPFSKVQVTALRMSMSLRDRPTLLLSEGTSQGLADGDEYVEFLNAESGTTWFEPDLRPLMAGWPYPSPPYDPRYKNNLNREEKSWVGGHRFERDSGERRGWLHPYQLSWTVDAAGHVYNAMRQITPETVIVEGTANLPQGPPIQDASTSPDPGSEGLFHRRKEQPFPQLRGYGLGRKLEMSVDFPIGNADERYSPLTHDCGWWIQSNTGLTAIGSAMLEQISRPTPTRSAKVEQSGWVKAGEKVLLRERRRNGYVIEEEIVVTPIEGETNSSDDSMTITGIVTARRVIQTDPDAPPVDEEEEWVTPPPTVPPAPPRDTTPPRREDDPGDPGDPPGSGPVKPSAPTLTYDPHGLLVVTWDGQNAAGGSAVDAYFGSAEVALAKDAVPEEVVGPMRAEPDGTFLYSEPSIDYGTQWYTRIRIVDRWGRVSPWSDGAGPVEVVPLVDPEQFEDLRVLLDQTRTEIADSGAILDQKLGQMEDDLEQAGLDIDAAEVRLTTAEGEIADASGWIADTGAQLGTNLAAAQDMLETAFPSGPFDVDEAIDAAVAGAGGNTTTYSNITEANKPGPAPTSTEGRKSGDIHRNRNNSTYEVYAEWMLGANGNWQPVNFGDEILRSLDVGKITGGSAAFEQFVSNNLTSNQAVINELWTEVVRSRKITADMMIVGQGENIFPDPWFEDEAAWVTAGKTSVTTDPEAPGGRVYSLLRNAESQYSYYKDSNYRGVRLDPGHKYRLKYHASRGGSAPHDYTMRFYIRYTDAAGGTISSSQVIPSPVDHSYQEYETVIDVPEGIIGGCTIAFWRSANTSSSVQISGVSLVSMTDSSLIVDGAVTAKKITITGDENNPDEAGLVANIASIMELDVENLVVTGTGTLDEAVIDKLWTDVVRSRKITTDMLLVGSGINLVMDPRFNDPTLNAYRLSQAGGDWYYIDADVNSPRRVRPPNEHASTAAFRLYNSASDRYYEAIPDQVYRLRYRARTGGTAATRPAIRCVHQDGSVTYTAADQSAFTTLAGPWQWVEYTWTAPTTAERFAVDIQEQGGATGWSNYADPSVVVDGASLIVDGTIAARHIDAESIAAEVGEFVYVEANHIKSGFLESAITLTGELVLSSTNGRIATAASGSRIELQGDALRAYSGAREVVRLDPDGLVIRNGTVFNNQIFSATASGVSLVGSLSTGLTSNNGIIIEPKSATYNGAVIEFRHPNFDVPSSISVDSDATGTPTLTLEGPHRPTDPYNRGARLSLGARGVEIGGTGVDIGSGYGNLALWTESSGKISLSPGGQVTKAFVLNADGSAYYAGGNLRIGQDSTTTSVASLRFNRQGIIESPASSTNLDIKSRGAIYLHSDASGTGDTWGAGDSYVRVDVGTFIASAAGSNTTSVASNAYVSSSGRFYRSTSVRASKIAIKSLDEWGWVKTLEPVTYYDKNWAEEYADELTRAHEAGEEPDVDLQPLTQQVGLIAEDVEGARAHLATYDADGKLSGVAYERLAVALLPWLHELEDRIATIEGEA